MAKEEEQPDLILRCERQVVGIMSRRPTRPRHDGPPPAPEPKKRSPREVIIAIANHIIQSSVKVTPEEADVQALEHISDAATRLERHARMVQKPANRGGLFKFLQPRPKNARSNRG